MSLLQNEKKSAVLLLFTGLLLTLTYKIFKFLLRSYWGLDPMANYPLYEGWSTVFRFVSSLIGIGCCLLIFRPPLGQFRFSLSKLTLTLCAFPITLFFLKIYFFQLPDFSLERFSWELPINLFTGISEEFVFRGMIFIGLWKFLGRWKAVLISSFYFAIWHYDVTQDLLGLTAIFFAGCFFSLAFSSGASLLTLSIFHFVYDQIHFGLIWTRNESIAYDVSITLAHCLLAILVSLMHPALKLDKLTGSLTE